MRTLEEIKKAVEKETVKIYDSETDTLTFKCRGVERIATSEELKKYKEKQTLENMIGSSIHQCLKKSTDINNFVNRLIKFGFDVERVPSKCHNNEQDIQITFHIGDLYTYMSCLCSKEIEMLIIENNERS